MFELRNCVRRSLHVRRLPMGKSLFSCIANNSQINTITKDVLRVA